MGLTVAAVVGLPGVLTATPARADGDPASDYLLSRNVFVPFDAKIASMLSQQLAGLTLDAKRKRYPIKVALIATPYDVGTARALWRKPQQHAHFLAQELSSVYRGRLLIAMPNGFGIDHVRHPAVKEKRVLSRLSGAAGGNGWRDRRSQP